ncbi:hypothetical protein F5B20DRAFT_594504 [Whalleya microplaca]|nr:hypothetical protein F5B20DRAFT_594504 [Whalleya microplaca]
MKSDKCGWQKYWGVAFKWTPAHRTPRALEPLIHTYDTTATDAVERLHEISRSPADKNIEDVTNPSNEGKPLRGSYESIQKHTGTDEKVKRLWTEINTVPDWVDWQQLERGQKVFYRYAGPAITTLFFLSLLGGMASGRTVETLDRTGGFNVNVVRQRLLETTQHTLNVTRHLESIKPGGDGFVNSVRVRLLHAEIRRHILQMAETRPEYYDMKEFGVPINDLDSIGTINTFSATVIWMGLPRQGIWLREQEIIDYLALWRYIAYIMGAPHDWMATPQSAKAMMESLLVSEIKPSQASANLANNIITGLQGQAPTHASREFMCAQTYWLNGRELSEALDIERPSLYYSALMLGQCILFMTFCYVNRSVTYLDERHIKLVRKLLFNVLLHDKSKGGLGYTTKFPLKHLPSFDRVSTERGQAPDGSGVRWPGIERSALLALVAFSMLVGAAAWVGGKIGGRVWWWAVGCA